MQMASLMRFAEVPSSSLGIQELEATYLVFICPTETLAVPEI